MTSPTDSPARPLRRWLLFIYRVPTDPPGPRTAVWRELKQLGAAWLQQAAVILPDTPARREALERLAGRIDAAGGESSLLDTVSPDPDWEVATIDRFNHDRDEEFAELVENIERFEDEVARESRREKFTFAELEDLEADWDKLQRWRDRIRSRDVFAAPRRAETDALLERARQALDTFSAEVERRADTLHDSEA